MVDQPPVEIIDEAPVTAMQMAMLLQSNGSDQPWVNVEQLVLKFQSDFPGSERVTWAWSELVSRYDALRTVIRWQNVERPSQQIFADVTVQLDMEDWRDQSSAEQDLSLRSFLRADRERGIALQDLPAWRLTYIQTGPARGQIVISLHHALFDGRSMSRLLSEFLQLVETGHIAPRAEEGAPFSQVATALEAARGQSGDAQAFFEGYLQNFEDIGTLSLPGCDDAGPVQDHRKIQLEDTLAAPLGATLTRRAEQAGGTLANLVQAAWGLVLARWQGRSEVALGAVRSGRHAIPQSAHTVGCLINTLPIRVKLDPSKTLAQLVSGLRRDTVLMHPHEQVAAHEMRQWGQLGSTQQLFSSVVMFERGTMEALVFDRYKGALRPEITLHEEGGGPLMLAVYGSDALALVVESDPQAVPLQVAQALLTHMVQLLQAIAEAPSETPLGELDMLLPSERSALRARALPDAPLVTEPRDMIACFQEQVARQPEALAVLPLQDAGMAAPTRGLSHRLEALSYQALDQHANGLAHVLQTRGVGPGGVVAISLERSPEFIVAMLAVLKLGAAFVPVDPTYPVFRQQHMIDDSGARVVVSRSVAPGLKTEGLNHVDPIADPMDMAPSISPVDRTACAYVIYTSGSTGTPKGVAVSRNNLSAHAAAMIPALGLSAADRVLQFASLSFDVSLEEIFPTLVVGATVVLRNAAMAESPARFMEELEAARITVSNLPTAFWTVLTDYLVSADRSVPDSLRLMIVGGELVKANVLYKWRQMAPDVRWINGYGPTEATITCTVFEADHTDVGEDVPIGRATAHAQTYVLAADGSLAPDGVEGELVIGGPAVALGYVGNPEQTAMLFRDDRFQKQGRLYHTGDRVKWGDDAQLCFLGRRDRQVKLRGFRIDLRDVERAIEDVLPGAEVVASCLNSQTPAARLVAWVKQDGDLDILKLSQQLRHRLPAHMRPELVRVETFPITAGGKVDLNALPLPTVEQHDASVSFLIGNETPLERQVQEAMAQVLGRKTVAVNEGFYDLGGHSLLAVELLGRLETLTGQRLGLMDLRENPTSRGLARIIETGSNAPKHLVHIQPNGSLPPLFAVHVLGTEECYFRPLARHLGADQPILGVSVGALDENAPTGVEFTARRYCADIMEFYPEGPINLMAVSLGSYIAFEMARQFLLAGREVAFLGLFDAAGPAGRQECRGLSRVPGHLKQARRLGLSLPLHIARNQLENFRYAHARYRARVAEQKGGGQAPTSVANLVAMNELAVAAYEPAPLEIPLTIFRAAENDFDSAAGIKAGLGWAPVAKRGFTVIDVPGGHLSMLEEPNVAALALHFVDILQEQQRVRLLRKSQELRDMGTVPRSWQVTKEIS